MVGPVRQTTSDTPLTFWLKVTGPALGLLSYRSHETGIHLSVARCCSHSALAPLSSPPNLLPQQPTLLSMLTRSSNFSQIFSLSRQGRTRVQLPARWIGTAHGTGLTPPVALSFTEVPKPSPQEARSQPIVILHGLFGSKQNWKALSKAMASRLNTRVFAVVRKSASVFRLPPWIIDPLPTAMVSEQTHRLRAIAIRMSTY